MNDKTEIITVLKDTAKRYEELEVEANSLLLNHEKMKAVLIKRANLIINLPVEVRKVSNDKSLLMEIDDLANLAKRITKNSKVLFGLMAMLTPYGSKIGDPNLLEGLIQKLEKE